MSLNEQRENVRRSRARLDQTRQRLDKLDAEGARVREHGRLPAGAPSRQAGATPRRTATES